MDASARLSVLEIFNSSPQRLSSPWSPLSCPNTADASVHAGFDRHRSRPGSWGTLRGGAATPPLLVDHARTSAPMGRAPLVAPYRAHARLSCPSSRPHRPVADTAHSLLAMEEGEWLRGWWDGFFDAAPFAGCCVDCRRTSGCKSGLPSELCGNGPASTRPSFSWSRI